MLGLASSSSSSVRLQNYPSLLQLRLEINLDNHRTPIQQQNQFTNQQRSPLIVISNSFNRFIKSDWRNPIGRVILKPTYRKNITNFVFLSAFISACICVGAQSMFPNAGFHSNYSHYLKLNHLKNSSNMSTKEEEEDQKLRTTQSLFCPVPILRFFNSDSHSNTTLHSKQRRWLQEENP
ncbi:hypothetical protein Pst134EA_033009 [Puccinia striiformis f. sp. tritici]|uniref:uncharacterized protein n=1 Tax=Puccinia striiformis f. sp. tritici TaxID=168172 RepID=UPI0020081AAF|nr:uncharacterized protein Pst134EA_033009 [Puccinia striiformis f. sp. tritici]KAH9443543.1 hypothetical protein Pst134EA_033009 [Puccinia striiformis f. sp. tritici]